MENLLSTASLKKDTSERTPLIARRATLPGENVPITNVTDYGSTREAAPKVNEHRAVGITPFVFFEPPAVHLHAAQAEEKEPRYQSSPDISDSTGLYPLPDAFETERGIFRSRADTKAFCLEKKGEAEAQDRFAAESGNEELAIFWGSGAIHWQQAADALDRKEDDLFPLYHKAALQAEKEACAIMDKHQTVLEAADFNAKADAALTGDNPNEILSSYWKKAANAAFATLEAKEGAAPFFHRAKNHYEQAAKFHTTGNIDEAKQKALAGDIQMQIGAAPSSTCVVS